MYVAMTRARNHLAVVYPLHVYNTRRGMDYSIDQLSRFVDRGVRTLMERVVLEEKGCIAPTAAPQPGGPALDLRAALRARFGGA